MNYFEYFIKGLPRRGFLKGAGAVVTVVILGKQTMKSAERAQVSGTVVEELPGEIFLHGSGISIPH